MDEQLKKQALSYHRYPRPGKISVVPTKPLANQIDLSLSYSPGVAAACEAISAEPLDALKYTSRGNLVGVVTNGSAVLGLGNIGPLASKPVMEGKGCLFRAFAGIDVFDIELDATDPDKLVDAIAMLEPTLGGINLEDIKAPECFYIERKLRERLNIPVFHDDQHGTAIIASAAILNGLKLIGKPIDQVRLVCSGAGAAAIACLDLLVHLGLDKRHILVVDSKGVIDTGREHLDPTKARYAADTTARTLADAVRDADIFLGCSGAGVLKPAMVETMATQPLILALANPEPEIRPELAKSVRADAIIATGRSDYPNQVNNVLCFPFIFRGALDVGATAITESMKLACVHALAALAEETDQDDEVARAYEGQTLTFGPDYLIPRPFDPRLITRIAPAVAEAAMLAGVATRPIADLDAYRQSLADTVHRSGLLMRPAFEQARASTTRIVFSDGEDDRVLRALPTLLRERLARPLLIGRRDAIRSRLQALGSPLEEGHDFDLLDPWDARGNQDASPSAAGTLDLDAPQAPTQLAAALVRAGEADGMICGLDGHFHAHLERLAQTLELAGNTRGFATMNALMLPDRHVFVCDTYVHNRPDAEQLADMTMLAAEQIRNLGLTPRVALLTSGHVSADSEDAQRMEQARRLLAERAPTLDIAGVMHADAALSATAAPYGDTTQANGAANLLVMPGAESANIAFNLLKATSGAGVTVGPVLLGAALPMHILTPAATVRRIVNMTALTSAQVVRARAS